MSELFYLQPNIQAEPLVDQWYAWSHLIPPATAARNLTERHFKIMDSYISAPQIHANAIKNPRFSGGPFIDYDGKRVDEIQALRDQTKKQRSDLVRLSSALSQLDDLLNTKARGFCIQPLYDQIPDILRGYVELVYDLNNNPSYRLIEPLLYRSKYYVPSAQSIMLSLTGGDDRPFVLSTPRLEDPSAIHCRFPFSDERVDVLFSLIVKPRGWGEVKELIGRSEGADSLLRSFLTCEPPPCYCPYTGPGARWRYFGHACVLLETKDVSLLFDPILSYTYESSISRYTYRDLPETIDYVLITHNHQDHMLFESLLQIRHRVKAIIVPRNGAGHLQDPSLKLTLQNAGFCNVIELDEMGMVEIESGFVTGLPFLGEHADLDVRTKLAYLVQTNHHKMLFAADSQNIEPRLYQHLYEHIGHVDVLFVGMECDGAPLSWLYGPLLSHRMERGMDESRRLAGSNYEQAIDIVTRFHCKEVYVYAMGQEPWLNHVMSLKYADTSRPIAESNRLIEECRRRGIVAERLFGEKEILIE